MMKKRGIVLALISMAVVGTIFVWKGAQLASGTDEPQDTKIVKTELVIRKNLEEKIEFAGFVKGKREVNLRPEVSGRLLKINKKEGESIRKGEILATIDADEFLAQAALAKEQIRVAQDAASGTEQYYDQLVDQSQSELKKAENLYSIAKKDDDKDDKKIAKRNLETAQEALKSARRMRDLQNSLAQGQIPLSQKQAQLSFVQINNTRIRAPFDGVVARIFQEEGALVSPQTAVFMFVEAESFELEIALPLDVSRKMTIGQEIEGRTETNNTFSASVQSISPTSDLTTRKANVTFSLDDKELSSGDFVNIAIPVNVSMDALIVSVDSLKKSYHENVIFVIADSEVKEVIVEIGISDGEFVEIIKGLKGGEVIVAQGQQDLRSGDKVKIYEETAR